MRKIWLVLIVIWISMLDLSQGVYYFANLNFKYSYPKAILSNFSNVVQFDTYQLTTIERYQNNTLVYTSLSDTSSFQKTFFNALDASSGYFDENLISYSYDRWRFWEVHFLTENGEIISQFPAYNYEISRLNITEIEFQLSSVLKNTNQTFYVFNPTNQTVVINRFFRQTLLNITLIQQNSLNYGFNITNINEFDLVPNATITSLYGSQIRAKVCKTAFNYKEYIAVWNSSTYIEMYECDYFQCNFKGAIDLNLGNQSWIGDSINFSFDCNSLLVEYDNNQYPSVYDLSGYRRAFYPVLQEIVDFKPLAFSINQAAILYPNGSFNIFNVGNHSFIKEYNSFGIPTNFSKFSWSYRKIIMNYYDRIDVYMLECWDMTYYDWWEGQCTNCSNTCTSCAEPSGYCLTCIPGYQVNITNLMECIPIPIPIQNSTIIVPTINGSAPINNNTASIQNIQFQPLYEDEYGKYGAHYYYELKTAVGLIKGFQIIGQLIGVIFKVLQIFPLAWLFLNFMNFWSICSFYLLLNADIPTYLQIILKIIYDKINTPIFEIDSLANLIDPEQEKLLQMQKQFGVSSSFVKNNLQSFIMLNLSILIAKFSIFIFAKFPKKSWLRFNLSTNLNLHSITINQFISTASNFFLPFLFIAKMQNYTNFRQILNLALRTFFIGFSFIFPFLVLKKQHRIRKQDKIRKLYCKNVKKKSSLQKIKKRQTLQFLQWVFDANNNTIVPFLCVIESPILYYIFGILFFTFGAKVALNAQNFKVNSFILALYHVLFHIFFAIVSIFGSHSVFIKHNGAMICAIIMFIGAIHQLSTLFFKVAYFIYVNIKNHCQKTNRIKDIPQIKIQIKQKKNAKLRDKMKLKIQQVSQHEIYHEKEKKTIKRISKPLNFKPRKIGNYNSKLQTIFQNKNNTKLQTSIQNKNYSKLQTIFQKKNNSKLHTIIQNKNKNTNLLSDQRRGLAEKEFHKRYQQNQKTFFQSPVKKQNFIRKRLEIQTFVQHRVKVSNILRKNSILKRLPVHNKILQIQNYQ